MTTSVPPAAEPEARGPLPDAPLRCGALPTDLLEQVADDTRSPRDQRDPDPVAEVSAATAEHQQWCPHCRAMLAELRELWAPVAHIAADLDQAPPSLARGIMERVTALAQHSWHAVVEENPGVTRVAAWVVAIVARRAAASVPGVTGVAGRVHPAGSVVTDVQVDVQPSLMPRTQQALADGIGVAGRRVIVQVQITAGDDVSSLAVLAHQVRRAVIAHVGALTGLEVEEVDVHISGFGEPDTEPIPESAVL